MSVLLSKPAFDDISSKELAQQLSGKKKAKDKLPTWFRTPGIYYPPGINLEQTSSEITARYKARLVSGNKMADLTGGFGVDTFFFSEQIPDLIHCECDEELHQIAKHNAVALCQKQTDFLCADGMAFLQQTEKTFDWLFLDPGRRDAGKKKVFLLSECEPNVTLYLDLLLSKAERVMIKASPMLDLSAGIKELQHVRSIHVVAVENEVKEILWILQKGSAPEEISVKTVNLTKDREEKFDFKWQEEAVTDADFSPPLNYLYEPNSAILKAGAFKLIGNSMRIYKLHEQSHLYTSEQLVPFPGRVFKVEKVMPANKKHLGPLKGQKVNVTTRNFPMTVAQIRKKFSFKDGGDIYLFFTTDYLGKNIAIQCSKIIEEDSSK
ncbi:class I SAM-dependent methyltransferase [Muriicola marianensis]|nr:class I SAM-dependent methyltransferase [Muriicola marianensis]